MQVLRTEALSPKPVQSFLAVARRFDWQVAPRRIPWQAMLGLRVE